MAEPSHADILAALQAQGSFRSKNPTKTFAHAELVSGSPASLTQKTNDSTHSSSSPHRNSRTLYCPREECSCVIIGPGLAEWIDAEGDILPIDTNSPFPSPSRKDSAGYWHVRGSPLAFDNIGFSKSDGKSKLPLSAPGVEIGSNVKWLVCAECDLGPIGWSFEGGSDAWLAVDRLRYGDLNP